MKAAMTWTLMAAVLVSLCGCAGLTGNAKMTAATAEAKRSSEPVRIETKSSEGEITVSVPTEPPAAAPATAISFTWKGEKFSLPAIPGLELHIFGPSKEAIAAQKVAEVSAGRGNGVSGDLKNLDIKSLQAPSVSLGNSGPAAAGGGIRGLKVSGKSTTLIFYGLGGLLVALGLVLAFIFKQLRPGLILAAIGGVLVGIGVMVNVYSWAIWIPVVLAVLAAVWFVFYARANGGVTAALSTIVTGVEKAPADASAAVKQSIAAAGGLSVKSIITGIKNRLGLNAAPAPAVASQQQTPPAGQAG